MACGGAGTAAVVAAAVLGLVGIPAVYVAAQAPEHGPLKPSGVTTGICLASDLPAGQDYTLAWDLLKNSGGTDATVRDVQLVGARNVTLVEARLMKSPLTVDDVVIGGPWGPQSEATRPAWDAMLRVPGARVAPGEKRRLVLRVRLSSQVADIAATRVDYEVDGRPVSVTEPTDWKFRKGGCRGSSSAP